MTCKDALYGRRSIRKYQNKEVSKDLILDILNCGRLAPSAKNRQPWFFVVVSGDIKNKIANLMINYKNEKYDTVSFTGTIAKDAPVLILVFKNISDNWENMDDLSIGASI